MSPASGMGPHVPLHACGVGYAASTAEVHGPMPKKEGNVRTYPASVGTKKTDVKN